MYDSHVKKWLSYWVVITHEKEIWTFCRCSYCWWHWNYSWCPSKIKNSQVISKINTKKFSNEFLTTTCACMPHLQGARIYRIMSQKDAKSSDEEWERNARRDKRSYFVLFSIPMRFSIVVSFEVHIKARDNMSSRSVPGKSRFIQSDGKHRLREPAHFSQIGSFSKLSVAVIGILYW